MTKSQIKKILLEELTGADIGVQGGDASTQEHTEEVLQENPALLKTIVPILTQFLSSPQGQAIIGQAIQGIMTKQGGSGASPATPAATPATGTV